MSPAAENSSTSNELRFVILWHELPADCDRPSHFDLMFESGDVLRTWSIPNLPTQGETLVAVALPDHRNRYLQYQGEVGDGRGTVTRREWGTYKSIADQKNRFVADVAGESLVATLTLTNVGDEWTLVVT